MTSHDGGTLRPSLSTSELTTPIDALSPQLRFDLPPGRILRGVFCGKTVAHRGLDLYSSVGYGAFRYTTAGKHMDETFASDGVLGSI
jgi:hypothetical protein